MEKRLGKIQEAEFGMGGYQDVCFGLSVTLGNDGWGVRDFKGPWSQSIKADEHKKWTERDRDAELAEMAKFVDNLLRDAKVDYVSQLVGVPVEVTFEGMALKSWRILTEVR